MRCKCNGLSGIYDPVHVGAPFLLSVEFTNWWDDMSWRTIDQVMATIAQKLTASGYTTGLVRVYQQAGYFNPYVVIEGYSGREYGQAVHLRDAVLSVVASEYSGIDYGSVRFEVTTYMPGTNQQQQSRYDAPLPSNSGGWLSNFDPNTGDWTGQTLARVKDGLDCWGQDGISNKLACALGVTPTQAMVIGGVGTVLLLFVIKKAL